MCIRQVFVAFTIMVSPLWVGNRIVCGVKILIFVPGLFGSSGLSTTWNDQSLLGAVSLRSCFFGCHATLSRKIVAMKTIWGKMMKG